MALLLVASVALINLDHRQHHLESIRAGISLLLSPLQYLVNLPMDIGSWAGESLSTRSRLLEENARLKHERLALLAKLQKYEALAGENTRLRSLLKSSPKVGERVLIAELLSVDFDPFTHQLLINKGDSEELFEGQPVIDAHGVMGQLVHIAPFTSSIILITDPNHAIPVQFNRTGLRAVALGTGEPDLLEIPHIPNNADIQSGDLLVTSGLGQRFPPGYPVARIDSFEKDPGQPYARVTAVPTAHLERSREVLLVWPPKQEVAKNE